VICVLVSEAMQSIFINFDFEACTEVYCVNLILAHIGSL